MKSAATRFYQRSPVWALITIVLSAVVPVVWAGDLYVSPSGKPANEGTRESPWDLPSALGGAKKIKAGDTLFLLAGTYRRRPDANYDVRLVGAKDQPIQVRPAAGSRAIID